MRASSRAATCVSITGTGGDEAALLLGDQGEVEERRAPAAVGLADRHRHHAELGQPLPQLGVEAEGLGGADVLGRRVLGVEAGERVDQLVLLGAETTDPSAAQRRVPDAVDGRSAALVIVLGAARLGPGLDRHVVAHGLGPQRADRAVLLAAERR